MTSKHDLRSLFGLKWNPFLANVPIEATYRPASLEDFFFRVEHLVIDGGFALLSGDPGTGKSVALRQLAARLEAIPDTKVAQYTRPQNNVCDFYRELGAHFGIDVTVSNRYRGFKGLRECWLEHSRSALFKPVLLIDEAQEVPSLVLSELRLLTSMDFDSRNLLAVVLCGDRRLSERFRHPDLVPLGSRIRTRYHLDSMNRDELKKVLQHCLAQAGAEHLMKEELATILAEQSMGNIRAMMIMANELLAEAIKRGQHVLDTALFLSHYQAPSGSKGRRPSRGT